MALDDVMMMSLEALRDPRGLLSFALFLLLQPF